MSTQAQEFTQARERQPKPLLKSLFWKSEFGAEFLEAARGELPFLWGRLNLLEDFYALNAPGFSERSRRLHDQLGRPQDQRPGWGRTRCARECG